MPNVIIKCGKAKREDKACLGRATDSGSNAAPTRNPLQRNRNLKVDARNSRDTSTTVLTDAVRLVHTQRQPRRLPNMLGVPADRVPTSERPAIEGGAGIANDGTSGPSGKCRCDRDLIWEELVKAHVKRITTLRENLRMMHSVILGQCTNAMRAKLKATAEHPRGQHPLQCRRNFHEPSRQPPRVWNSVVPPRRHCKHLVLARVKYKFPVTYDAHFRWQ